MFFNPEPCLHLLFVIPSLLHMFLVNILRL